MTYIIIFVCGCVFTSLVFVGVSMTAGDSMVDTVQWLSERVHTTSDDESIDITTPIANLELPDAMTVSDIWGIDMGLMLVIRVEVRPTEHVLIGQPYNATLWCEDYVYGTTPIVWGSGESVKLLEFDIDRFSKAFKELAEGQKCADVFEVTFGGPF